MTAVALPPTAGSRRRPRLAGLSDVADQRTQKLSGGQTQRARFAVAVVGDPSCWCWTSRPSALDVEGRRTSGRPSALPARGKTVLFATHYLDEADANADRVVLLAGGPSRGRRPAYRDQSESGHAYDQGDPAGADALCCAGCPGVTRGAERGGGEPRLLGLGRRHPRAAATLS